MSDRIRWPAVAAAVLITAAGVLPAFMTAALAVQIQEDLGLSVGALGVLFGMFFAVSALASSAMGRMVENAGWVRGIQISGMASGLVLIGMATVASSTWSIAALFVLGGIAAALSHPAANLAIARSVPQSRQGLLFGLKHTAVPAAAMLGGIAVPVFGLTVGWRWAFAAAAILAIAPALAAHRIGETHMAARSIQTSGRPETSMRILLILAGASALGVGGIDALATFVVAYGVDIGFGEAAAGVLLAVGSVAGLLTRLLAGWLVDRRSGAGLPWMAGLLAIGAVGLALIAGGGRSALVVGAVLALGLGWGWSGLLTFVVVRANPGAPAAATGVTQAGTFVGAAVGPPLVGLVAEHASFSAAWWITSVWLGIAVILALVAWWLDGGDRVVPGSTARVEEGAA